MENNTKKKIILIGAGLRGKAYTDIMANELSDSFEVVAVAEPLTDRRNYIRDKHGLPEDRCYESWEELLKGPKIADAVIIATMDRDHFTPAMAAIERGYNLLLEKPVCPTPRECRLLERAAEEHGVFVLVCHVLRFTKFFIALKDIIDSGEIGEVMNIQHTEGVGNVHQSHSFVRGNWSRSGESSDMLLQKSCHDMDILAWLIGKRCKRVHSFGTLSYFNAKNAPTGAPEYCIDGCPEGQQCPYNAKKLYLDAKNDTPAGLWFRSAATKMISPTDEAVEHALRTSEYGKCVFRCSNDVVDHQVVNLEFEGGAYVGFTMSAFNKGGRSMKIMGTLGEIEAIMDGNIINVYNFETKVTRKHDCSRVAIGEGITSGHGGGDQGIVHALYSLLCGRGSKSICSIKESCDNHMIAFAAEESRRSGKVISLDEYCEVLL